MNCHEILIRFNEIIFNGSEFQKRKLQNLVNKLNQINKKWVCNFIKENHNYKFENESLKIVEQREKMLKRESILKEFLINLTQEKFSETLIYIIFVNIFHV